MLFGKLLRCATSRSGSASPDERNAPRMRDEWTTDLTRYGSRGSEGVRAFISVCFPALQALRRTEHQRPVLARRTGDKLITNRLLCLALLQVSRAARARAAVSHCETTSPSRKAFDDVGRRSYNLLDWTGSA